MTLFFSVSFLWGLTINVMTFSFVFSQYFYSFYPDILNSSELISDYDFTNELHTTTA